MGDWIELDTRRGPVRGWHAAPDGEATGGLVVIQEIFGVNGHIRDVADRFAREGFEVIAPSLFDPVERGVELGYDEAGIARGRELVGALGMEAAVDIVDAAAAGLREHHPKVGAVGFCWGGSVALLANTRLGLPAIIAGVLVVHGGGLIVTSREYSIALIVLALVALVGLLRNGRRNRNRLEAQVSEA